MTIPAVGLALGILFLDEPVAVRLLIGAIMIVGGIAVVNLKLASVMNTIRGRLATTSDPMPNLL